MRWVVDFTFGTDDEGHNHISGGTMARNTTLINGRSPVTKDSGGKVVAAPDVCKTPTPGGPVPIPYTNVSQSSDLANGSKTCACTHLEPRIPNKIRLAAPAVRR